MKTQLSALLCSAIVLSGAGAFAQAAPQRGHLDAPASPADEQGWSTPTTLRVGGTIEKYDASARMLSLVTPTGSLQFPIAETVRIRQSGRRIAAAELKALRGYRAAVRYSETHGMKTIESVSVFEKPKG